MQFVEKRFWVVLCAGVVAGLALPSVGDVGFLVPYLRYFVMTMLFMVFLKVDVVDILHHFKDVKLLSYITICFLLLMPAAVYLVLRPFDAQLALGALILTAMPPGTAAPTLTDLIKGNTALAASITIIGSLLAPLSIPFVLGGLSGESIQLDRSELFVSLATTIFVPLVLSQLLLHFAKPVTDRLRPVGSTVNIVILFCIIYSVIAAQRGLILEEPVQTFRRATIVFVLFVLFHIIGYYMAPWLKPKDRLAVATTRAYQNLALAIVVAAQFFGPEILLIVVLAELPWAVLPGPFKVATRHLVH